MRAWPWLVGGGLGLFAWSRHREHTPTPLEGRWVWPLPRWNGRAPQISDGFGIRKNGVMHKGVDLMFARQASDTVGGSKSFVMPDRMNALAASDGVVWSAMKTPRGNAVVIKHGATWSTFYQHLEKTLVTKGDRVRAGQPIGIVGADPLDSERLKHLHFELWRGSPNDAIDPAPLMHSWSIEPDAMLVARNAGFHYRPIGASGDAYPEWVRALKGKAGVYIIREIETREVVYVGSSEGRLYDTLTRHFQTWRRCRSRNHARAWRPPQVTV